jgi:hypothetical protein
MKGLIRGDSSASLPKEIIQDLAEDEIDENQTIESLKKIGLGLEQVFKFKIYLFLRIRILEPKP